MNSASSISPSSPFSPSGILYALLSRLNSFLPDELNQIKLLTLIVFLLASNIFLLAETVKQAQFSALDTLPSDELNQRPWRGKECAVVLTYDDALHVHLDNAIPLLDSLGLKGTFYLSGFFPGFKNRIQDWKRAAANGHELGNHTLFHPCNGQLPGREWVNPVYDLSTYSVQRMVDEVRMTNVLLETLDGGKERTFAFTCGDMHIGEVSFMDSLRADFAGARAVRAEMHSIDQVELYNIDCYAINGENGNQLIELVEKARETKTLLVFLFHGVGGEHSLNVSLEAHRQLLLYLKKSENKVWTTTMLEAIRNIKQHQHMKK